jgi:hypothetical protein
VLYNVLTTGVMVWVLCVSSFNMYLGLGHVIRHVEDALEKRDEELLAAVVV